MEINFETIFMGMLTLYLIGWASGFTIKTVKQFMEKI